MKKLIPFILILLGSVYTNAQEQTRFIDTAKKADRYANDPKNILKVDFLSPLFGSTVISCERSLKPGISLEGAIGIIGLGMDPFESKPRGAFMKIGPRFVNVQDHLMEGLYFQPQVVLGAYQSRLELSHPGEVMKEQTSYLNFLMVIGKQKFFANVFSVDYYCGFGYGFVNYKELSPNKSPGSDVVHSRGIKATYGAYTVDDENSPFSISAGIKIGLLFR